MLNTFYKSYKVKCHKLEYTVLIKKDNTFTDLLSLSCNHYHESDVSLQVYVSYHDSIHNVPSNHDST